MVIIALPFLEYMSSPAMHSSFENRKMKLVRLRGGSATATTIAATELRSELARSTTLLALTSIAPAVSTLAVTTVATTATAEWAPLALALTEHSTGRSMRSLLLDVGGGDDLGGEVKPFAEVVKTLGGQGVVVVLPGELGLDIAAGSQGLASLDHEEVLGVDVGVLGKVEVLLSDEYTLAEEVLVDLLAVGLGNQHRGGCAARGSMLEVTILQIGRAHV